MQAMELKLIKGHLFAEPVGNDRLLDTGAPTSFVDSHDLDIDGIQYALPDKCLGLNAARLSGLFGVPAIDLVSADSSIEFDMLFNVPGKRFSMDVDGEPVESKKIEPVVFMKAPAIEARITDQNVANP